MFDTVVRVTVRGSSSDVSGLPGTGESTIAAAAARRLGAAVLGHDGAMSALRPYPELQATLDGMDPAGHRPVGWSILFALDRDQLRRDAPVVLDGVARCPEIALAQAVADEETPRQIVVMTQCSDAGIHRSRVVGRQRGIPSWYELDWQQVQRARDWWEPISGIALTVERPPRS